MHKIAMPSSCNFASYSGVGSCMLKYTGATNVINPWREGSPAGTLADPSSAVRLDINIEMGRCSGAAKESIPVGAFGVSGQWANVLRDVTPCNTDSECASKFGTGVASCFDFAAEDSLNIANQTLPTDWMFHDAVGGVASAARTRCTANVHLKRALRKGIMALAGKRDTSGDASLKFCAPDAARAEDSIKANGDDIGDALSPTQDDATEIMSIPYLVSNTADALWYPGKQSSRQQKVASAATYSGVTVAEFTNIRQAAFKHALAASLTTDAANPFDVAKIEITDVVPAASRRMLAEGDATGVTITYEIEADDAAAATVVSSTISSPTTGVASSAFNQDVWTATADLTPEIEVMPVLATTEADCDTAEAAGIPCTTNANVTSLVQASNTELTAEQPASVVETAAPIAAADIADLTRSPTPAPETFAPTLDGADADATFAPAAATAAPTAEPTSAAPAGSAPEVQTSAPEVQPSHPDIVDSGDNDANAGAAVSSVATVAVLLAGFSAARVAM
jgi:hypothetical protein